jgi:ubiquinone/menaquinone biosynthesis C-methylase UbiE
MAVRGRKRESALRKKFNVLAEEMRFGDCMERDHGWFTSEAVERMELKTCDRVLDIACGEGWACRMGSDRARDVSFVGVDISDVMLERAQSVSATSPRVHFVQGSVEKLPFLDHAFTKLLCVESFFLFPDIEAASREMLRVLNGGGTLTIVHCLFEENRGSLSWASHLDVPVKVFSTEQYKGLLERTGWEAVEVVELSNKHSSAAKFDPHNHALLIMARKPNLGGGTSLPAVPAQPSC